MSSVGAVEQDVDKKEFNDDTLRRYYGDVTPYGTLAKKDDSGTAPKALSEEDTVPMVAKQQSTLGTSSRTMEHSTSGTIKSGGSYGTTLRRSKGGFYTRSPEPEISLHNIGYIDFLPKKRKEGFVASRRYHGFSSCVEEANRFLDQNPGVRIKNFESVLLRLDHNHRINPESMTSHDRSYVISLRLWYVLEEGDDSVFACPETCERTSDATTTTFLNAESCAPEPNSDEGKHASRGTRRICYINVVPDCLNSAGNKAIPSKHKARPAFQDVEATVKKLNESLSRRPIPGHLISVETIPINYYHAFRDDQELDTDYGYWCLDYHDRWSFFLLRAFYLEGDSTNTDYEIGFEDFCPGLSEMTERCPGIHSLTQRASRWLSSQDNIQLLGSQSVEIPFHPKKLDKRRKFDSTISTFETSKSSAFTHTIRILRVWFMRFRTQLPASTPSPSHSQQSVSSHGWPTRRLLRPGIAVRTFLPCQVTTSGCCGVRKPMFATTEDTVERIKEWISLTGADVICVQTDNIEKWSGDQCKVGDSLGERIYNKQDFSRSLVADSLEYRLTVLRVYVRADAQGVFPEPDTKEHFRSPTPVQPCCCFVGCSVM